MRSRTSSYFRLGIWPT